MSLEDEIKHYENRSVNRHRSIGKINVVQKETRDAAIITVIIISTVAAAIPAKEIASRCGKEP